MGDKVFLPTTLVDWAQVLGAVATAAAVIVTLFLARRDQREYLRGYVGYSYRNNADGSETYALRLEVTNYGLRPAIIALAHLEHPSALKRWGILRHYPIHTFYFRHDELQSSPITFGQSQTLSCFLEPKLVESVHTLADARRIRMIIETTLDTRKVVRLDKETAEFTLRYAQSCRERGSNKSAAEIRRGSSVPY